VPCALRARGCGNVSKRSNLPSIDYVVLKFSDISEKRIPFFDKYPLHGIKALDYADFRKMAEIIKVKGHLTPEGLAQIIEIKHRMNTGRNNQLNMEEVNNLPVNK
jgi:hypothetical protein